MRSIVVVKSSLLSSLRRLNLLMALPGVSAPFDARHSVGRRNQKADFAIHLVREIGIIEAARCGRGGESIHARAAGVVRLAVYKRYVARGGS